MGDMSIEKASSTFEREAATKRPPFVVEFWQFLSQNKKWWLLPICVILLLFSVLMLLGGTAAAPFIYTLF
jgi:hypothetical protein